MRPGAEPIARFATHSRLHDAGSAVTDKHAPSSHSAFTRTAGGPRLNVGGGLDAEPE